MGCVHEDISPSHTRSKTAAGSPCVTKAYLISIFFSRELSKSFGCGWHRSLSRVSGAVYVFRLWDYLSSAGNLFNHVKLASQVARTHPLRVRCCEVKSWDHLLSLTNSAFWRNPYLPEIYCALKYEQQNQLDTLCQKEKRQSVTLKGGFW